MDLVHKGGGGRFQQQSNIHIFAIFTKYIIHIFPFHYYMPECVQTRVHTQHRTHSLQYSNQPPPPPHYTVLYCSVLYYAVLCCTVLYRHCDILLPRPSWWCEFVMLSPRKWCDS